MVLSRVLAMPISESTWHAELSSCFGMGWSGQSRRFAAMHFILSVRRVCNLVFAASQTSGL
jgi:hypothetical protein